MQQDRTYIPENAGALPIDPLAIYPSVKPTDTPPAKPKPILEIDLAMDALKRQIKQAEGQISDLIASRLPLDRCREEAHQLSLQAKNYFEMCASGGTVNAGVDLVEAAKMCAAERLAQVLNGRYHEFAPHLNAQIVDRQKHISSLQEQLVNLQEREPILRVEQERAARIREWEMEAQRILINPARPHEAIITLRNGSEITKLLANLTPQERALIVKPTTRLEMTAY